MPPVWELAMGAGVGAAAGGLYFGGLWWTLRRLPRSARPHLLVLASFAVRLAAVVAAMVVLARRHWSLALAGMAGVVLVRVLMVRRLRPGETVPPAGPGGPAGADGPPAPAPEENAPQA